MDFDVREITAKFKAKGFEYFANGSYGTAFIKPGEDIILKITEDELELDHIEALEDKKTRVIVPVSGVNRISEKLGYYFMPKLDPLPGRTKELLSYYRIFLERFLDTGNTAELFKKVPYNTLRKFVIAIYKDYIDNGINPEEVDFHTGNILSYKNNLKLIDP